MSEPARDLVITVHGIRTYGHWQERLGRLVIEANPEATVYNYKYGYFSVFAFMIPFLRWLVTRRFRRHLVLVAAQEPWRRIHIVAHSFGTHLVGWSLRSLVGTPVRVHTVILAGSVLKTTFAWEKVIGKTVTRVVNDCGSDDSVLVVNQVAVLFTGMAGRTGFNGMTGAQLVNRFHLFGHSGYFEGKAGADDHDEFMRTRWIPLLATDCPVAAHDERGVPTPFEGFITFVLNNSEPIKVALVVIPVVMITATLTSWEQERKHLASEALGRRDRLLVSMAQQMVSEEPTAAVATLKQMTPTSSLWRGAWLVANEALSRGVANTLHAHAGGVNTVDATPDGVLIASGGADGHVSVWRATTKIADLNVGASVDVVRFVDQGQLLSLDEKGRLMTWSVRTGESRLLTQLLEKDESAFVLDVSRDGTHAVIGHPAKDEIRVVKLKDGAVRIIALRQHGSARLFFSHDNRMVCSASPSARDYFNETVVSVFDVQTNRQHSKTYRKSFEDVAFTANSESLLVLMRSPLEDLFEETPPDNIVVWNFGSGTEAALPLGDCKFANFLGVSPRTGMIVATREDNTELCIWNNLGAESSPQILRSTEQEPSTATTTVALSEKLYMSRNGRYAAAVSQRQAKWLFVWDLETRRTISLKGHGDMPIAVAFPAEGQIASGASDGRLYLWSLGGAPDLVAPVPSDIRFGHRPTTVTTGGRAAAFAAVRLGRENVPVEAPVRIWHADDGSIKNVRAVGRELADVVLDGTGSRIAALFHDGQLEISDIKSNRLLATRKGVGGARLSASGRYLLTVEREGIRVWRVVAGSQSHLEHLRLIRSKDVTAVSFANEGETVAYTTAGGNLVFTSSAGSVTYELGDGGSSRVELSADGTTAVVPFSRGLLVYRYDVGLAARLPVSLAGLNDFAVGSDGATVVASSQDGAVRVWDIETGARRTLITEPLADFVVSISPDDTVRALTDERLLEWDLYAPQDAVAAHRSLAQVTNTEQLAMIADRAAPEGSLVQRVFASIMPK